MCRVMVEAFQYRLNNNLELAIFLLRAPTLRRVLAHLVTTSS